MVKLPSGWLSNTNQQTTNTTMFDPKHQQIADNYFQILEATSNAALALGKMLREIYLRIQEAVKNREETNKIAVEVGKDIYNLVPDESTPGAYKWEKVDLNQETGSKSTAVPNEPSEYQAQTIATRIVQDVPDLSDRSTSNYEPALKITAYTESGDKTVIYEQDSEGKCRKNLVTEHLSQDEIMDVAYEPLVKLLPPSSELVENYEGTKEFVEDNNIENTNNSKLQAENSTDNDQTFKNLSVTANDMLSEVLNENFIPQEKSDASIEVKSTGSEDILPIEDIPYEEETVGFLSDIDISNPPDLDFPPDEEALEFFPDINISEFTGVDSKNKGEKNSSDESLSPETQITAQTENQLSNSDNLENNETIQNNELNESSGEFVTNKLQQEVKQPKEEIPILLYKKYSESEEESQDTIPKKESSKEEEQYAAQYTYQQVANSQGVEPAAQQWARQVEVPVYQINNKQAREERYKGENKDIAQTATAMLKKYGTVEQDGSRIYRSDAFVIRLEGDTINIHRRSDELSGWENSLMEFKLNKKEEPKITKKPTQMLRVERQEFLMVAEHLNDNGKLPDLSSADIRDVANSLGSLAPAGTIKTLEVFKQNEILLTLNNVLIQADREELTVGEFTIKRSRDPENNRASLQLFKTTEEKGTQELVRFDLTKTEAGITKEVSKMNISDYDINQVKFIAQNAQKLNLEQIFGNEQPTAAAAPTSKEQPIQTAGDIPVKVHPYIAEEWANMVKHGGPDWGGAMNQGNEEILQRIKDNSGKLPIADQREMYFKLMTYKATVAEKQGENTMEFVPLKDIMQDLQQWRGEEIKQQYTPTENIPFPQRQTVTTAAAAPKAKSGGVEL